MNIEKWYQNYMWGNNSRFCIKLKGEFIAIGRRLSTQILQIFYTSLFENNKTIEMIISLNTAKSTRHTAHLYFQKHTYSESSIQNVQIH